MAQQENLTMDVKQVAEYVGCSTSMIRKLVKNRKIPYRKLETKIIFDKPVLELWKKSCYRKEGFRYE